MFTEDKNRTSRIGSFWNSTPEIRKQSRQLVDTINSSDPASMVEAAATYLGQNLQESRGPLELPVRPQDSVAITPDNLHKLESGNIFPGPFVFTGNVNTFNFTAGRQIGTLQRSGLAGWFAMPWPHDWKPFGIIDNQGRRMLPGIHFIYGAGALLFPQDPRNILSNSIHVTRATRLSGSFAQYTARAPEPTAGKWVYDYLRKNQQWEAFLRAAAQACGFIVLPETGLLLRATNSPRGFYTFDWGSIHVPYPHPPLTVGQEYGAGTVVGFFKGYYGSTDWWLGLDWGVDGLDMKATFGIPGVTLTDSPGLAYVESIGPEGPRIRFPVQGSSDAVERFWSRIDRFNVVRGYGLSAALGITEVGETTAVRPIHLFLTLLRGRVLGLRLRSPGQEGAKPSHVRWIREHVPAGCFVALIPPEDITPDGNLFYDAYALEYDETPLAF